MLETLFVVAASFLIGTVSAFILIVLGKFGIINWIEIHLFKVCYFCWGFWISVILTALFFEFVTTERTHWYYILIPISASIISLAHIK